jgi:uncharacterized OB-fold protein
MSEFSGGTVYTETVVHSAPEQFVKDAPYQVAIVTLDEVSATAGRRLTARIQGERVKIGDRVTWGEERDGIPFFQKQAS